MFKGFFWKIWLLGIFCSFFAVCLMLFVVLNYYLKGEEENVLQRNNLLIQVMAHDIESGYLRGIWPYKTLKMVSEAKDVLFLWVVKPDGKVFWANESSTMEKIVQDPFLGAEELKVRSSHFRNEEIKLIANPIKIELKEKPWTIFLGVSLKQLKTTQKEIVLLSTGLLALITILIGFVSYYFSKRITKSLKTLANDLEIIGQGNLGHIIKIKTGDEVEDLADSFNRMSSDLKRSRTALEESKDILEIKVTARTKELNELNKNLEGKVEERTKELQKRLDELERFHRLTVGRELKMIELKKELRKKQITQS
ncbi:MAG: HAMP domain-containing protein [Candidatus Gribaldobacteria bacterium]|nr:HAMP domain-containing protein [Candidatus Gribaldobacteria bacterium]